MRSVSQHFSIVQGGLAVAALFLAVAAAAQPVMETPEIVGPVRPGTPFYIDYPVSWPSGDIDYAIEAPDMAGVIDWGIVEPESVRATTRDGRNVATLRLRLEAAEAGEYDLPPVRIGYIERGGVPEPAEKGKAPAPLEGVETLLSEPVAVTVRPAYVVLWTSAGLLAALAAAFGSWLVLRRGGAPAERAASAAGLDTAAATACIHAAKAHRLDGAYYEFYLGLQNAVDALGLRGPITELSKRLGRRAQEIGYQGQRPSDDDMDGALRDVERALAKASADGATKRGKVQRVRRP